MAHVTPFHVPRTTVVFKAHRKFQQYLFSHKQALEDWARGIHPCAAAIVCEDCVCEDLPRKHKKLGERYAALGSRFSVGFKAVEQCLLAGTMGNMLFPDRQEMSERLTRASSLGRQNQLPTDLTRIPGVFEHLWQIQVYTYEPMDVRSVRNIR